MLANFGKTRSKLGVGILEAPEAIMSGIEPLCDVESEDVGEQFIR